MSVKLSTHVLDLTTGRPAADMFIALHDPTRGVILKTVRTNADGRTDEPLLEGQEIAAGVYVLVFHVGEYFGIKDAFLDQVPVRFRITDLSRSYHVPLLCTPWAYSTYRGS